MELKLVHWRSLKTRVTLFTLAIFLACIWALDFYASRVLREDMQRLLSEQQYATVALIAGQVNDELGDRLRTLERVAASISPAMMQDKAALQAFLASGPALHTLFNAGNVIFDAESTAIADYPAVPGRAGVTYKQLSIVRAALDEGRSSFGKPILSKTTSSGNPIIGFGVPIRDAGNKVIGVLAGVTDLGKPNFLGHITDSHYGSSGGYLLVVPRFRLIVTATDKRLTMTAVPAPGTEPLFDRFIGGHEGSGISVNADGVEVLTSAKSVPVSGWYVMATLPTADAFAPIRAMQQRMLAATLLLTLLAGGLTWWMLKRQLSPMLDAVKALATLPQGAQPPQPLRIAAEDEIGELIGAFNRLVQTLGEREEALRRSEDNFRLMVDAAPVALILSSGIEYRTLLVNRKFTELFGYTAEDVPSIAQWWPRACPDADYRGRITGEWMRRAEAVIRGETSFAPFEFQVTCKDGSIRTVEWGFVSVDGRNVAFGLDLTERKQAEAGRERLASQLRESQKMEALGTLAGGVAHDFNNVLTAIMGNLELARQDAGPGRALQESLEEIGKAGRRGKNLVQQILAFGRRQAVEHKVMALAPVVRETEKLLRSTLPAGVALNVVCAPDAPAVLANATQIEQVLINLCTNAWHAIRGQERSGSIDVLLEGREITARRAQEPGAAISVGEWRPGRYACLTVQDGGSGMDRETLAHLFEPFFTTKTVDQGTGLGLAVVHGIAIEHGANIEVDSTPGTGSVFRLYIPAAQEVEDGMRGAAAPVPASPSAGQRVLYVDDDEAIVFLMKRLLQRQGYRVSGHTDARAAIEAVRANPGEFDLVVTDYNMPGMSGLDVVRALKQIRADLPVALVSGYITEELRELAPAAGIAELIYKPNTIDELYSVVARLAGATESVPQAS